MPQEEWKKKWDKWATVYADGSFHAGQGGWAARVRHGYPPFKVEFSSGGPSRDSMYAEMAALVCGVALAIKTWPDLEGVGVRTDCKALTRIASYGAKLHRRKDIRELQEALQRLLGDKVKIKVVWVQSHQSTDTKEAWMNNRVDELAGKARRGR